MGIKNLLTFLSNFPDVIKKIDRNSFSGKKIAIDISILIYQVVIGIRNSGSDKLNDNGDIVSHILGVFNKSIFFLEKGIIPIYVFDGKPPLIKQNLLQLRRNNKLIALNKLNNVTDEENRIKYFKRTVFISKNQMDECRELLELMGIPYINAPEEADSQLSYLCKSNIVHAVLSEDMDILTFGSPNIIRNLISNNKTPIKIELSTILNKLNISYNEFIELCILFGCDYCPHIHNIKLINIYNIYMKYKSIDKTLTEMKRIGYIIPDKFNYSIAKEYFIKAKYNHINDDDIKLRKPNIEKLLLLLVNKYGLNEIIIYNKLIKLNYYYNKLKNI